MPDVCVMHPEVKLIQKVFVGAHHGFGNSFYYRICPFCGLLYLASVEEWVQRVAEREVTE